MPTYPASFTCGVAVMAKASAAGRTKTRLAPVLTGEGAARLNTSFLRDIADNLRVASQSVPIHPYMAFGPPGSEPFFESILPPGVGLIETWLGDFGACLRHAVSELLARGHSAACVLNADSPTLPTDILIDLATALAAPGDRAVLGPSSDGGYYVLGLKSVHGRLFEDIAWSTDAVAEQTLERARDIGLPVHVLPTWYDVDEVETLGLLRQELFEGWSFGGEGHRPYRAPHTRALLETLGEAPATERLTMAAGARA